MTHRLLSLSLIAALGCGRGDDSEGGEADARRFDARVTDAPMFPDSPPQSDGPPQVDGPPGADGPPAADAPPGLAPHLLLTEVDLLGAGEFIEIYNPTDATVDLRNYYLSDNPQYFLLPSHAATPITMLASDFIARFPAGATIAPRQVIVIAMDAMIFPTEYATALAPTYAVDEVGTLGAVALDPIVVTNGTGSAGTGLTNSGEMVVLFHWDGASDLVEDVDIMIAGDSTFTSGNNLTAKTPVDGPDSDAVASSYAADMMSVSTMAMGRDLTDPSSESYERVAFEGANEAHAGTGNGILGDDETSENIQTTWSIIAAGTPGTVPPVLE